MRTLLVIIKIVFVCVFASGCSARYITTEWKNQHAYPGNYSKIMLVAVVNSKDSVYRKELEKRFAESLESFGYPAISSYSEFGTGLRNLDQEETYKSLCDKGIDAVMSIAWINKEKETDFRYQSYSKPVEFFFDRMWHYKKDQSLIPSFANDSVMKYSWEIILFDLPTLQPHYVAQTRTVEGTFQQTIKDETWKAMIKRLRKDRFLKKRPPVIKTDLPKAF